MVRSTEFDKPKVERLPPDEYKAMKAARHIKKAGDNDDNKPKSSSRTSGYAPTKIPGIGNKPIYKLKAGHVTLTGTQYAVGQLVYVHTWNADPMTAGEMTARVSPYNRSTGLPASKQFQVPSRKLEKVGQ